MDHLKKVFVGDQNDLHEAAHILIKVRQATKDFKRNYLKSDQEKLKRWEKRADEWIEWNIKEI